MTTEIIVEKVDREAAADLEAHEHDDSKRGRFMSGEFDSTGSVQLFARHRLAERERVVAWLRDPTTAISLNVAWASYRKDGRPTAGTQQSRGTVFLACIDAAAAIERGGHAIAMETGTAMTAGHGPKDDSAGRQVSPGNGRTPGQEEG